MNKESVLNISPDTLEILKNFSTIQSNLLIREGTVLETVSESRNIVAKATVADVFPQDFGIWDLPQFLALLSLFTKPSLDFKDKFVIVKEGSNDGIKSALKFYSAAASMLTTPKTTQLDMEGTKVTFDLSAEKIKAVMTAAGTLGVDDLQFASDGSLITLAALDKDEAKTSASNSYTLPIEEDSEETKFCIYLTASLFRMIDDDYEVQLGAESISQFKSKNRDLTYWMAPTIDSVHGK
jgi:hypothetical protein